MRTCTSIHQPPTLFLIMNISDFNFSNSRSKIHALVEGVSQQILEGKLSSGDNLPSINEMSDLLKVSRDTVFKAYKELRRMQLIESNPMKGYYITGKVKRILLLLDTYSSFKQDLYKQFVTNLSSGYKVDLLFHQYNEHLFETIIRDSAGKYSMYVVMNFSNEMLSSSLKKIPAHQLLLLDFGNFDKTGYNYICQDFDQAFFNCLMSIRDQLSKYSGLCFVFPTNIRILFRPSMPFTVLAKWWGSVQGWCAPTTSGQEWKLRLYTLE